MIFTIRNQISSLNVYKNKQLHKYFYDEFLDNINNFFFFHFRFSRITVPNIVYITGLKFSTFTLKNKNKSYFIIKHKDFLSKKKPI